MTLRFTVDEALCERCSLCSQDCPAHIIEQDGEGLPFIRPEQEGKCYQCQHCLALCPTAAISILGRKPEDSLPLEAGSLPGLEQMSRLVRGRRSIRQYKDENVDPVLLHQLLTTLANAPTGVNRRELTFTVVDDRAVMQKWRETVYASLREAAAAGRIPDQAAYLRDVVETCTRTGEDILFRGAPHALIVSAPREAPCPHEDVVLALAYFELLAQSAGLGTVWWGFLKFILETLPALKALVQLPADHHYYAMLFGVPSVQFARTVQRDDAAVVRRVTL